MARHMTIEQLPYGKPVQSWLKDRYEETEANQIWDQPPVSELQDFVQKLFMGPFTKLGKIFDLNRPSHMWLIDKVFRSSGNRDRKDILKYLEGFVNIDAPMIRSIMRQATASRSVRTLISPKSTAYFMYCRFCATATSSGSVKSMGH